MTALLLALLSAAAGAAAGALAMRWRASAAVREARTSAAEVVASASEAVIVCDTDGVTVTAWNPAAEQLFGWRAEEVLGQQLPTLGDEAANEERALVLDRVRRGERVSIVTQRVRKDGTALDVRINYSAIRQPDGAFGGWMGTVTDVTEEVAAARERSERAGLLDRLNALVAAINEDLDLAVVLERVTASATELCDAAGASFAIVEPEGTRIAAGDGLLADWVGYRFAPGEGVHLTAFAENRQIVVSDYEQEPHRMRTLQGVGATVVTPVKVRDEHIGALALFFAEPGRTVSDAHLETLRLLAGHAGSAIANARAYGAMARGRALAQEVLDRLVDGVAVLDDAGHVTRWNRSAAQLTGLGAGEVLGRPFPWRTGTRAEPAEHRLRDDVWMETIATALPEAGGSMVVLRDISRHMTLQEAKSLFLATASHQLRTPLTVIGGYAQRLRDRYRNMDAEEIESSIDAVLRRAQSLERTIDQLLAGSLAELGQLELDVGTLDLTPILEGATTFLAGSTSTHRFVVEIEEGLPPVVADGHAVESILAQLLENAVKYSPDGGVVGVRAVTGRDDVAVSVSDQGVGLEPGEEERIFERFARGSSGMRGTGLGLFIVQRLVEAQQGRVWAQRHDGPGATFSFTLPRI